MTDPTLWRAAGILRVPLRSRWVTGVETPPIVLEALQLVLFVCFTDIVAWGRARKAWQTDQPGQLVYDDPRVEKIEGDTLQATGSSPLGTTRRDRVDLNTGRSEEMPLGVPPANDQRLVCDSPGLGVELGFGCWL
jgi:hypothetical protein